MKIIQTSVVILFIMTLPIKARELNKGGFFIDASMGASNYNACGLSGNKEVRCYGDAKSIALGYISKVHVSKDAGYKAQFGFRFERGLYDNAKFDQTKVDAIIYKVLMTQKFHYFKSDLFQPIGTSINIGYQWMQINEVDLANKKTIYRESYSVLMGPEISYDLSNHWSVGLELLTTIGSDLTLNNNKNNGDISQTTLKVRYVF